MSAKDSIRQKDLSSQRRRSHADPATGAPDFLATCIEEPKRRPASLVGQGAQDGPFRVYQHETFGSELFWRLRLCVNELWGKVVGYCAAQQPGGEERTTLCLLMMFLRCSSSLK